MIDRKTQDETIGRLKKIEGQIKGVERMIESKKYCIDIINQIRAVRGALDTLALEVMKRHINSCVSEAIRKGSDRSTVDELMETIYRFVK